jgi:glutathione synthase/RimK-type ligase-like ATP-grasp enzyme
MSSRGTVVFVVDDRTVGVTPDDAVLADAVRRRGLSVRPVVWSSAPSSFAVGDVVLIRSPYDYVERPAEFRSWLDDLDECGATALNATPLLRWNMHKGYLDDLAARGVAVVPTEVLAQGSTRSLAAALADRGWSRAVVKPAIGASARQTISVDGADAVSRERGEAHVRRLVAREDVLVQPFVASIQTDGEVSLVVIGGEITHAVLKQPTAGEWRVQSEFGGAAVRVPVTAEHERVVASVLGAVDGAPIYARVDLVGIDGELHLMELELIEPELFFRIAPEAADRLADRLADLVLSD